jgi:ubiquinone/menaquinone biosynthesis C-methylase UbiE
LGFLLRKSEKSQRDIYDIEYKEYAKYHLDNWRISYLKRIFELLEMGEKDGAKDTFLDIGVGGSGYTVIEAARKGYWSIGVDISMEGIRKAHKFASTSLTTKSTKLCDFLVCSAEKLPFKDQAFGKICSVALLEHVADDDSAISEISRVIAFKGKVFIAVPNAYQNMPPFIRFFYRSHDRKVGHLRHYTVEELIKKFFLKGMVFLNVTYIANFPKIVQYALSLLFPRFKKSNSRIWWKLEYLDSKFQKIPTGLHVSMCFKKSITPQYVARS